MSVLAIMNHGHWEPGVGDPTVIDWTITIFYFISAGFCGRSAWREHRAGRGGDATVKWFWTGMTVFLVLMGFNKQLDFQEAFIAWGRDLSERHGWYEHRRAVQALFVLCWGAVSLALLAAAGWYIRRIWKDFLWVLGGFAMILLFVLMRAGTFNHVNPVTGEGSEHTILDAIFELTGNTLICIGLWRDWKKPRRRKLQAFERIVRIE